MMTRRLELDETQSTQIQNIMAAAKPEFDALHEKGTANREATRGLEIDDPDYGAKLQNLSTTRGELAASSAELRGRIRAEIHAILTPEQREKLASVPERRRDRDRKHQQRPESQAPAQ